MKDQNTKSIFLEILKHILDNLLRIMKMYLTKLNQTYEDTVVEKRVKSQGAECSSLQYIDISYLYILHSRRLLETSPRLASNLSSNPFNNVQPLESFTFPSTHQGTSTLRSSWEEYPFSPYLLTELLILQTLIQTRVCGDSSISTVVVSSCCYTKYHTPGGIDNRSLFLTVWWAEKSKPKVWVYLKFSW